MHSSITRATIAFAVLVLAGCAGIGPGAIKNSRNDYNIAIQQTGNEQLLLNIVRLKYRDTPSFLELTSVTTSFSLQAAVNASTTLKAGTDTPYTVGGNVVYADKPTVTYTPLQGDKFVTQIMSPIDAGTIGLLYHSGWSIERVLRLVAQDINGVRNAPTASGPTPDHAPEFDDFKRLTGLLRALQTGGAIQLGSAGAEGNMLEMRFREGAHADAGTAELVRLLGLNAKRNSFPVVSSAAAGAEAIGVNLRSLMGILFYVSQAVEVPKRDIVQGRVTVTRDDAGGPFDWAELTGDLIRIRSSELRPDNAYLAIAYRGAWFYIDDSDLDSKSTFSLLTQLAALAAGDVKTAAPVLTLPVGQ